MIFVLQEDGSIRSKRRRLQWQWSNTQLCCLRMTHIIGGEDAGKFGGESLTPITYRICQYNYMSHRIIRYTSMHCKNYL